MIKQTLLFVVYLSFIVSPSLFAIDDNADHAHETDAFIFTGGVYDGVNTRYTPAFSSPVPDNVVIDEIYLRIEFKSGENNSINRMIDISCGNTFVFEQSV